MQHLKLVLERIAAVGLKLKPVKCRFAQEELEYLGHIVSRHGLKTSPRLTKAVQLFPMPKTVGDIRRFLGLSYYYRKFIPNFAKLASPLHNLTRKDTIFQWTPACHTAFTELKQKLVTSPVLAYPNFSREFVLETDASILGIGAVLAQQQHDQQLHPVAYASRALSSSEKNYAITELETLAVVWALSHFHCYLYGKTVTVYTDHTAVKSVLEASNPTGKHAHWWTRVYGSGIQEVRIIYRAGRENKNAEALSRSPVTVDMQKTSELEDASPTSESANCQLSTGAGSQSLPVEMLTSLGGDNHHYDQNLTSDSDQDPIVDVWALFQDTPPHSASNEDYYSTSTVLAKEQRKDQDVSEIIDFLEGGKLPEDIPRARKLALQAPLFTVIDHTLYFIDSKRRNTQRAVVPRHLRHDILKDVHSGPFGGHFSGPRLFKTLANSLWWEGMYRDALKFARTCPECNFATGTGRTVKPPLHPIPVSRPFQIFGIDIMDLPLTDQGNRHVVVIQDLFTKWPLVFPVPDQKTTRIARIIAEEMIPLFGVPECLLSDRGTNLLSTLMKNICTILGITKLNTTSYHPQCDSAVERFNRTLKTVLRKHAAKFGSQWDRFLPGVLFAYRNTPHSSTGEKPSFLLYGVDCRSPTEAAYLPTSDLSPYDLRDYREELMLSLTSARELAADTIQRAQARYKHQYDKGSKEISFRVGDWILVRFPQDESGRWWKLSRPWHGPYRIVAKSDPGVICSKVYYPQDEPIRVHQSRICLCPQDFPAGFFWYGGRRRGPGRPPRWVEQLLRSGTQQGPDEPSNGDHQVHEAPMQTHPQTADSDLLQPQDVPAAQSPTPTLEQDLRSSISRRPV